MVATGRVCDKRLKFRVDERCQKKFGNCVDTFVAKPVINAP
jgi:hypothetical protein